MKVLSLLLCLFILPLSAQEVITEEVPMTNGEILIPGTLSYPQSENALPLAIFIQGSGNVDRNGNQAGTMVQAGYIKTLRDSLNSKGIAFYSYDKRTAIPDNISKLKDIRFEDLISDAQLAIKQYLSDSRFSSLHVIGHSQGSLVGMKSLLPGVSSFISVAGPGVSIDKKLIAQISRQSPELGETTASHFKELMEKDTIATVQPLLYSIFAPQNQKFLKSYAALDPAVEIKKLSVPTLILNGEADLQVSPDDAQLLHTALPSSEIEIIPKLNHVLKEVNSMAENQQAYMMPGIPLSIPLLHSISRFILENN